MFISLVDGGFDIHREPMIAFVTQSEHPWHFYINLVSGSSEVISKDKSVTKILKKYVKTLAFGASWTKTLI